MLYRPRCHALLSVVMDGRGGPDSVPRAIDCWPRQASVCRNGFHDADTWSLEFDARVLPVEPGAIRSIAVGIYMWGADSSADHSDPAMPSREMVRGLADMDSIKLSSSGQFISMDGRDYTGLLLDVEWNPKLRIPSGKELDATIEAIANDAAPATSTARFRVEWLASTAERPIVGAAYRSTKRKKLWVKPGKTTWDVIYEMALENGFIAYVDGETIKIIDADSQTAQSAAAGPQMIYGRNLQKLEVERKLTREKVPQLRVTAWDPFKRERVTVLFPANAGESTNGVGLVRGETMNILAPKRVHDRDALLRYARVRFANMARGEISYKAETRHLRSLDNQDLFQVKAGTPITFGFDPFNKEQARSMTESQLIEHMVKLGYSQDIAELVAAHTELLDQWDQPHYIKQIDYDYSSDDGISISFTALNYAYEPREDQRVREAVQAAAVPR